MKKVLLTESEYRKVCDVLNEAVYKPFFLDGDIVLNLKRKFSKCEKYDVKTKQKGKTSVFIINDTIAVDVSFYSKGNNEYCTSRIYKGTNTNEEPVKCVSFRIYNDSYPDNDSIVSGIWFWAFKYTEALLSGEELPRW